MKNLMTLILLSVSLSSLASSYEEKTLATCEQFSLIKMTIQTLDVNRNLVSEIKYKIRSDDDSVPAQKIEFEDVDLYEFSIGDEEYSISSSFEFSTEGMKKVFRMNGQVCSI